MTPDAFSLVVGLLGIVAVGLTYGSVRRGSPRWGLAARWARWAFIGLGVAQLLRHVPDIGRPLWVLAVTGLVGWQLVESAWNWWLLDKLSRGPMPLLPRYDRNLQGDEWPALRRFILMREELRKAKFVRADAVKVVLQPGLELRASLYLDTERRIRLEIFFLPLVAGGFTAMIVARSRTADGGQVITDNVFMPFGGLYPDDWNLHRNPWMRRLSTVLEVHARRVKADGRATEPWEGELVDLMNAEQRQLEHLNIEHGILVPPGEREEHGTLTYEGRYRLWKELWLLNYLGIPSPSRG